MKRRDILILCLIGLVLILVMTGSALFQEGNPTPFLIGIIRLTFSDEEIVQIPSLPKTYISTMKVKTDTIIDLIEKEGYELNQQLGYGPYYAIYDKSLLKISLQYTRRYRIWRFD